jgi:hypothetical protein
LEASIDSAETSDPAGDFKSRRSTDAPEVRSDDDRVWPPEARQTRN